MYSHRYQSNLKGMDIRRKHKRWQATFGGRSRHRCYSFLHFSLRLCFECVWHFQPHAHTKHQRIIHYLRWNGATVVYGYSRRKKQRLCKGHTMNYHVFLVSTINFRCLLRFLSVCNGSRADITKLMLKMLYSPNGQHNDEYVRHKNYFANVQNWTKRKIECVLKFCN